MKMKISVGEKVEFDLGGLHFEVLRREIGDDGGTSIEVYDAHDRDTQVLRFDCFRKAPHYHMPPSARGQLELDPAKLGDGLDWSLQQLRTRLPEMLLEAGFPELSAKVDLADFEAGWTRVRDAVAAAPAASKTFEVDVPAPTS